MPSIAGEAAVRIVPSLKGFHAEAQRKIDAKRLEVNVHAVAKTGLAEAQLDAFRLRQEAKYLTLKTRLDMDGVRQELSKVQHIFERNNMVKAIRLNVKIIGLDALPALAYAAGSAASGLDALAKSAFLLPGAFAAAGASIGTFALGLHGIGDAFKAQSKDAKDSAKSLSEVRNAQRDLERAQKDVTGAIRDQRRELEDLNAELRRASLDEADALLNLQESADRLKQGGFKSVTEYQRAQIRYLRDIEALKDVRKDNIRLLEDTSAANEKGIAQGDKVVGAIEKVTEAVDRLNDAQSKSGDDFLAAMGKLSPNAQKFVTAVEGMKGAWEGLRFAVQDNLFAGLDREITDVGNRLLPGLKVGLGQVATGLNGTLKAVLDSVGSQKNMSFFDRIFGNTQGGLENFKRGLDPLITGFTRMATVGTEFLPRLGVAFSNVMSKFDKWTEKISTDGTLAHWIDQGLNALTSLGNAAKNIGSIISSVGEAFNSASGTEGGFIGSLERQTKKWADYLKGEGKAVLTDYFTKAKELIRSVKGAFGDMRPLIKDIIEAARNFSTVLLPLVGGLAKMAEFVQRNTGLVTGLFYAYASWRTIAPLIDGIKNSWKNYIKVTETMSRFGPTSSYFTNLNTNLANAEVGWKKLTQQVSFASSPLKNTATASSALTQQIQNLIGPSNNLTGQFSKIAGQASFVQQKVGFRGQMGTLLGALGSLASFIGPAIGAGILGVAISAGISGLMSLEGAHDKAKEAADRQREALANLKGALDGISGAATAASLRTAAETFQNFQMGPVVGNRNVLEDVSRAGLASPDQLLAATLPMNQNLANEIDRKAIDQATSKIESSDMWDKYGQKWRDNGVTARDLALAAKDDPDAQNKVAAAEKAVFGKARRDMNQLDRIQNTFAGNALPSVADVIVQAGIQDEASTAMALAKAREQNVTGGNLIQQATRAAGGPTGLTAAGVEMFAKFGATNNEAYLNPEHTQGTLVVTSDPGELDPAIGQVTKLNDKQWKIDLTEDATPKYMTIPKYARGGLIHGKGTGTSDSNLMLASTGEFVARKAAVDHYGVNFFDRLNSMQLPKFDGGGLIGPGFDPKIPAMPPWATPPLFGPGGAAPAPAAPAPVTPPVPPTPPVAPPTPPAAATPPSVDAPTPGANGLAPGLGPVDPAAAAAVPIPSVPSIGMGRVPYSGMKPGTNIAYGGAGFPDWVYRVANRFGLQASTYAGHQERGGTNKGIDWSGPPDAMRAFAQYVSRIPGMEQVIFMDPRDNAKFGVDPGDRGPNQTIDEYYRNDWANHTNHVHTRLSASIPTPEELAAFPGLPFGVNIGAGTGSIIGGISGAAGTGGQSGSPLENLIAYWTNQEWLKPENVDKFLQGTAQNVGSSLLGIGTSFLSGITGIDLSSLIGYGQQIGNFVADKANGTDSGSSGGTGLNDLAGASINSFLGGTQSLGMSGGLDGLLGGSFGNGGNNSMSSLLDPTGVSGNSASSVGTSAGAERWRPVVRQILATYGPQYGIKNLKAWEDAIVTQIKTESGGDPGSVNPKDSNGKGGTQKVAGLLNFLESTFSANNITGGDFMDPVAQIAAVIPYVINKYGMNPDGSPRQIGKPGIGFARGGRIRGMGGPRSDSNLVRVSRGEFLHNANAVNYYGADFLSRLNNLQVPKDSLPGFEGGMWWDPFKAQPAPAPAPPPPAPLAPPPPAPPAGGGPGQVAGPLPLSAPADTAPSTGGAPGPGATAPAPDPGALPQVEDPMAGIGGALGGIGGGGLTQPGAAPSDQADPRANLGAAPTSQNHNSPAVSGIISGIASTAGSAAALAANLGMMGAGGAGAGIGGMPGVSAGIQAGAQMAGAVVNGAVNVLSSLMVGTATNGSTTSASGIPLLPQRQPMQTGVPAMGQQYQDNRTYNITNLDEYKRMQERDLAQSTNPYIGKF